MERLSQRLRDASGSGAYRASRADPIMRAASSSGIRIARIRFAEKPVLMKNIAAALEFPHWFGENWDALEDCLSDLSWLEATGHLLLFEGASAGDDFGVLVDVLGSAAGFWASRGTAFFAVFIDPVGELPLPELSGRK